MHICQPVYRFPHAPVEVCPDCRNIRICPCCGRTWQRWGHQCRPWGNQVVGINPCPTVTVRLDNYAGAVGALAG